MNRNKYKCWVCDYRTHNKSNYRRHLATTTCFLWRNKQTLPWPIRKLIMAFASPELLSEHKQFIRAYSEFCHHTSSAPGPLSCNQPGAQPVST